MTLDRHFFDDATNFVQEKIYSWNRARREPNGRFASLAFHSNVATAP
jgi:hypothetical protein